MADITSGAFKWTERRYTLREFEELYGNRLPQIVLVWDGYSSSNSNYTISSEDIFLIKSIVKQPRLVVEDQQKRKLSIPLNYQLKFNLIKKLKSGGTAFGPARTLREILHHHSLKNVKQIRLDMNKSVSVLAGAEDTLSGALGAMSVEGLYYERYYLAHSICDNAKMHPYQFEFPVYVPITVQRAIGLTVADDRKLTEIFTRAMELAKLDPESDNIDFSLEIMLFEEQDDNGYEWVNPGSTLECVTVAEEDIRTVERLKIQQEDGQSRRERNPGNLDIGIPVPRPRLPLPHEKPRVDSADPLVREILQRPKTSPPPIPSRGQKRRRDKNELKLRFEHLQGNIPHKETINKPLERFPSVEHDINTKYSCVSFTHFPLVGDGDNLQASSPLQVQAGPSGLSYLSTVNHQTRTGDKPHENVPTVQIPGALELEVPSLPRQPSMKGPPTAPKVNKGPGPKVHGVPTALAMIQKTQEISNTSISAVPSQGDPIGNLVPRKNTCVTEDPFKIELHKKVIQKGLLLSQSSDKDEKNHKPEYLYAIDPRNRPVGKSGKKEAYSEVNAQEVLPKTSDIVRLTDVPKDISTLTVGDINACLRLLHITREFKDVDGSFLVQLSEADLKSFYQMSGLEARKITRFVKGWRPQF